MRWWYSFPIKRYPQSVKIKMQKKNRTAMTILALSTKVKKNRILKLDIAEYVKNSKFG